MYQDNITLCGASAYEKKFYFNQDFNALPDHVKKELQIMCVLYTEDVGGILTLEFDENGSSAAHAFQRSKPGAALSSVKTVVFAYSLLMNPARIAKSTALVRLWTLNFR